MKWFETPFNAKGSVGDLALYMVMRLGKRQ